MHYNKEKFFWESYLNIGMEESIILKIKTA